MIEKKNIPYYLMTLGVFLFLKFSYTISNTDNMAFLLKPTNKMVSLMTGFSSVFIKQKGYYFEALNIIIDKSCSGFNFLLICFLMLSFLSVKYFERSLYKTFAFISSIFAAFLITLLVNSSRIMASIIIEGQNAVSLKIDHRIMHESIGIITNLSFLIFTYFIVEKLLKTRKNYA